MSLLDIRNLTVTFAETDAVRGISFALEIGEIVALVGESGSGKSVSAHSILKLLPPEATITGDITFNGESQTTASIARWRGDRIGMVFQEPMTALNPLHPIRKQMIESFCWHKGVSPKSAAAKARLEELFRLVGLEHLANRGTIYPHQLSGGERQRVMIAMAIANQPDLLIADEPTTALDVTLQRQIMVLLRDLQRTHQMGMLFITHDLTAVREFADRVLVMHEGVIVEEGRVDDIFAAPKHPYTQMLLAAAPQGHATPIAANAPEILSTDNLTVTFPIKSPILRRTIGSVAAVAGITLTARAGETIGIVGESGSGKSSLGYAILKLIPSQGPIVFLGHNLSTMDKRTLRAQRADMQLVFQDPYSSLNPRMNVGELIAEGLRLHQPHLSMREISEKTDAMLVKVGLTPAMKSRYPHAFSGGQRQRIAIARAMILEPKLLVLDEPTSALDMSVQGQVLDLLRELQRTHGVTYLFISHDLRVIRAMAHQVLVLKRGELVEQGPTEAIFTHPQQPYTQALLAAACAPISSAGS